MTFTLSTTEECNYLYTNKQDIEKEINILMSKLDEQISLELIDELSKLKSDVLDNKIQITDDDLNYWISKVLAQAQNLLDNKICQLDVLSGS